MVVKKSKATPIKISEQSTVWDYPMPSADTGITYQNLNGRLPARGWYRNNVCREIFFVTDGTIQLNIDGQEYSVVKGDVVILEPGQKHYGDYANTSLITITSPDWYDEQCEIVED